MWSHVFWGTRCRANSINKFTLDDNICKLPALDCDAVFVPSTLLSEAEATFVSAKQTQIVTNATDSKNSSHRQSLDWYWQTKLYRRIHKLNTNYSFELNMTLTFQVSQGSAATDLRWGENFYMFLFRNSLLYIAVKKLRKSVNICPSYRKIKVSLFYGPQCKHNSTKHTTQNTTKQN